MGAPAIVLHIGMHKTGTSAIQSFLSRKAEDLLDEHDLLYVRSGRNVQAEEMHAGHHRLAWSTVRRYAERYGVDLGDRVWNQVVAEIEEVGPDRALISSEFFWPARPPEIASLRRLLPFEEVRILIFLRNPFDMAVSAYKQVVKTGRYTDGFKAFVEERRWYYDYATIVQKWERVFGEDNVEIAYFDEAKPDVVGHLVEYLGLPLYPRRSRRENVSPPDEVVALARGLNVLERRAPAALENLIQRTRRNIICQREPGRTVARAAAPILPSSIAGTSERVHFRRETETMRTRFLERYVDPEDHHWFEV